MICINKKLMDMNLKYENRFMVNDDHTYSRQFYKSYNFYSPDYLPNKQSIPVVSGKCVCTVKSRFDSYIRYFKLYGLNKTTKVYDEILNFYATGYNNNYNSMDIRVRITVKGSLVYDNTTKTSLPYYWNGDETVSGDRLTGSLTTTIREGKLYLGTDGTYGGWDISAYDDYKFGFYVNDYSTYYVMDIYDYITHTGYNMSVKDFTVTGDVASLNTTTLSSNVKNVRFMTDEAYNILKKMNVSFYDGSYTNTLYTVDQITSMMLSDNEVIYQRALDYLEFLNIITAEDRVGADMFYTDYFNYTQTLTDGVMKLYNNEPITFTKHYIDDTHKSLNMVIIGRNPYNDTFTETFLNPDTGMTVNQIKFMKFKIGSKDDQTADIKLDYINRIDMLDSLSIKIKLSNIIN